LLGKERRRKPPNISARGLAAVCDAIPRVLEPLLGGFLELGGDDRGLGESERPGGAAQTMSVAAQRFDGRRVGACSDQPFG